MSIAMQDGAWVSTTAIVRFDCTACGTFHVSTYPMNEREQNETIKQHASTHKGLWSPDR